MSALVTRKPQPRTGPLVRPFPLVVTAIQDLGPRLRRVTFGGACLLGFATDDGATWDLRVKLVVPSPGRALPPADALLPDGDAGSGWHQAWQSLPEHERGVLRSYTVREARLDTVYPEIDVDFVLHPDGVQGPAVLWARGLRIGDPALLVGPCAASGECRGIEFAPGRAKHVLLAGDETALPAIEGILRDLPSSFTAEVVLEIPDGSVVRELPTRARAAVTWLERDGQAHGSLLTAAVRQAVRSPLCAPGPDVVDRVLAAARTLDVGPERVLLWDTPQYRRLYGQGPEGHDTERGGRRGGTFYAWMAGEAGMVTALRRHLVRECGIDREQVAFMGYWKQGTAQS